MILSMPSWTDALVFAALSVLTIRTARQDWRTLTVPLPEIGAIFVIGTLVSAASGEAGGAWSLGLLLAGWARCLVVVAAFYGLVVLYRRWRGVDGLGAGDIYLAGAWAPFLTTPALAQAVSLGAIAALAWYRTRHPTLDRSARLPFGAFLAFAFLIRWATEGSVT